MASYNQKTSEDATKLTPCIEAAVKLLDHLEHMRLFPDEKLPVPFVMGRLSELIAERLVWQLRDPREESRRTVREEENWDVTTRPEEEDNWDVTTRLEGKEDNIRLNAHGITTRGRISTPKASNSKANPTLERFKADMDEIASLNGALYVDLQFLSCERRGKQNTGTVIKEFAVTCEGTETVAWIKVRPPEGAVPCVSHNEYAVNVLHCINWESGDTSVEELRSIIERLLRGNRIMYVKGMDKVNVLADQLGVPRCLVSSLDMLTRLEELRWDVKRACPYHENFASGTRCALRHADVLKKVHLHRRR